MSDGRLVRQRLPFERNFTQIPNSWLRDRDLSLKARGLLAMLWSYPEGFKVTVKQLSADGHGGKDYLDSAARELEAHGYLARVARRARGAYTTYDWVITDPLEAHQSELLTPRDPVENLDAENPQRTAIDAENPQRFDAENPHSIKNTINTLKELPKVTTEAQVEPVERCVAGHNLIDIDGHKYCELACRADYEAREKHLAEAVSS